MEVPSVHGKKTELLWASLSPVSTQRNPTDHHCTAGKTKQLRHVSIRMWHVTAENRAVYQAPKCKCLMVSVHLKSIGTGISLHVSKRAFCSLGISPILLNCPIRVSQRGLSSWAHPKQKVIYPLTSTEAWLCSNCTWEFRRKQSPLNVWPNCNYQIRFCVANDPWTELHTAAEGCVEKALPWRTINLDVDMKILLSPWLFIFLGKGCRSYHSLLHPVKRNYSLLLGWRNSQIMEEATMVHTQHSSCGHSFSITWKRRWQGVCLLHRYNAFWPQLALQNYKTFSLPQMED